MLVSLSVKYRNQNGFSFLNFGIKILASIHQNLHKEWKGWKKENNSIYKPCFHMMK
jgi:hypothetical protein